MEANAFDPIIAAVSLAGLSAGFIAMGGVKIVPNVTRWGVNKLVSFFR